MRGYRRAVGQRRRGGPRGPGGVALGTDLRRTLRRLDLFGFFGLSVEVRPRLLLTLYAVPVVFALIGGEVSWATGRPQGALGALIALGFLGLSVLVSLVASWLHARKKRQEEGEPPQAPEAS